MKRDDNPPVMASEECSRRIRRALRAELDQRWGQRGAINTAIGHDNKYLNKVCFGVFPIKLDELLLALEVMAVDAGRFFANALDAPVENDLLLKDLERFGEIDHRLGAIERATVQLELSQPLGPAPPIDNVEERVSEVVACNLTEERRRLGTAQKYCHPAFAAAYLEHLDALRYDDPRVGRENARVVAVKLIPRLPGPQRERMALQLKAIGIFASGHRQKANFATAARAVRFALAFARRHRLPETVADLLQRGAYVLRDHGRYLEALELLDESLVIHVDLDSAEGLGSIMVDRGSAFIHLGEYAGAVAALRKSLRFLEEGSVRSDRNRLAAYQALAYAYEKMGDIERAEHTIVRAAALSEHAGRINRAMVLWRHGSIALARGAFDLAEERLRQADELFDRVEDPNKAMLALDLTKALRAQGESLEAVARASSMGRFLAAFRGNKVAQAALNDLTQTAVRGELTVDAIEKTQAKLVPERGRSRHPR